MAKHLTQPILVVAPQYADRLDITGYTVDAQARTLTLAIQASGDDGHGGRVILDHPNVQINQAVAISAMAQMTRQIILMALTALKADPQLMTVVEQVLIDEALASGLYYAATRDQLYALL